MEEQIYKAIEGYNRIPSNFAWLQEADDSILGRADNVFLAKYGRDPTEDADFTSNGDYHKICKNLKRDRHYYDTDLKKLQWDYKGHAAEQGDWRGTRAKSPPLPARLVRRKSLWVMYSLFNFGLLGFFFSDGLQQIVPSANLAILFMLFVIFLPLIIMFLFGSCCSNCGKGHREKVFGSSYICKRCGARL